MIHTMKVQFQKSIIKTHSSPAVRYVFFSAEFRSNLLNNIFFLDASLILMLASNDVIDLMKRCNVSKGTISVAPFMMFMVIERHYTKQQPLFLWSYGFGTTWSWVEDRSFICWWTTSLKAKKKKKKDFPENV